MAAAKQVTQKRDDTAEISLALATTDAMVRAQEIYSTHLENLLQRSVSPEKVADDKKTFMAYRRLLSQNASRDVMNIVWMNSKYVKGLDAESVSEREGLSKNEIAMRLAETASEVSMVARIRQAVLRTIDALQYFGLVEIEDVRSNLRLVKCTKSLHNFLLDVNLEIARELSLRDAPK